MEATGLTYAIEGEPLTSEADEISRGEIESVLATNDLLIAWQPIVSLETRDVLGYEALARFAGASPNGRHSPSVWFKAADRHGLRKSLELLAVRSALPELDSLPETAFVSFNLSPATAADPDLAELLSEVPGHRLIIEIAEDAVGETTEAVLAALGQLRERGVRIALDDTGSGVVSLRQLVGINADIIKIDTDVVHGIDVDEMKQAIAFSLKSLAEHSGAMSLAEGVESEKEAAMLASLGIDAAQGFLFGRPGEL